MSVLARMEVHYQFISPNYVDPEATLGELIKDEKLFYIVSVSIN
jgi:hypothetical protein